MDAALQGLCMKVKDRCKNVVTAYRVFVSVAPSSSSQFIEVISIYLNFRVKWNLYMHNMPPLGCNMDAS